MSNTLITRAPCRHCLREVKHIVVATRITEGTEVGEDYGPIYWRDTYDMLECGGCETITLRHTSWFSGTDETDITFYPPPISRSKPHWLIYIGRIRGPIQGLMNEIYTALHADNRRLALLGARSVVDQVLVDKIGGEGTFASRLEALEGAGYVSHQSRTFLEATFDAGSAVAHRGFNPDTKLLTHVMDIVENILQSIYVLELGANELRDKTPPRRR